VGNGKLMGGVVNNACFYNNSSSSSSHQGVSPSSSSLGNVSLPSSSSSSGLNLTCGSVTYDPAEKFCYNGSIYFLCGGEDYNPITEECISNVVTPIQGDCNGTPYNKTEKFCYNNKDLYSFCDGQSYDPTRQKCVNDELIYLNYQMTCSNGANNCIPEKQVVENNECIDLKVTYLSWSVTMACECNFNGNGSITIKVGNQSPIESGQYYVRTLAPLGSGNGGTLEIRNICVSFSGNLQPPATGVTCKLE